MSDNPFHRAIYLTGPTASGKTAVGVALARRLDTEIVAMDSTTIYRRMDIGTAKPTPAERGGIPHHVIDVVEPWESASVADYLGWARAAIASIESRGRRVLFVGGTPLYLKALLRGLFDGPGSDPEVRRRLEEEAEAGGDAALHARLATLDPATAARLHPNDRRRVAPATVPVLALDPPRERLHERIDRRVLTFFERGLVHEVRSLQAGERPMSSVAAQAIGYREVIAMLAGRATLAETIERVQARSRQFAKRQGTWFRGLEEVEALPVDPDEDPEAIAERIAGML
jgi:tRNA dimethylallyltransferase